MAIAIQKKVAELDKNWREVRGITEGLKVRIGISTGYCTVGNFGSVQRVDYTVLGSTVNLASRLETICQPEKILVAPETKSLLEKEYKFKAQEAFELKGFNKPVIPFQYVDLKKTTSPEKNSSINAYMSLGHDVVVGPRPKASWPSGCCAALKMFWYPVPNTQT